MRFLLRVICWLRGYHEWLPTLPLRPYQGKVDYFCRLCHKDKA